jgi:glucose/arabinose dehydrogenase
MICRHVWRHVWLPLVLLCQFETLAPALPFLPAVPKGDISIQLIPVATGMGAPDYGINPPGDTNRLFVLEQIGTVRIIQNGTLLPGAALDITNLIVRPQNGGTGVLNPGSMIDERGLLGLAFHPGFNSPASPGYRTLYTYTSEAVGVGVTFAPPNSVTPQYKNLITEWKMSASDPNVIDPTTRREVVSFGKTIFNHNGGTVAFGPDGYLYLALGDGGDANDAGATHNPTIGNAQDLSTPLGKVIRIDPLNPNLGASSDPVSPNGQYRIPPTNPFQGAGQVKEIYAYGFRNPYRFAFDSMPGGTGDLILADVGQNNIEEINRVTIGGNYGWVVKEGTFLFNRSNGTLGANSPGSPAGMIDPIVGTQGSLQYDHGDGISITGGFVYRGSGIPALYGKYVFGDLAITGSPSRIDGRLFYADLVTGLIKEFHMPQFVNDKLPNSLTVHGFGQDGNGELYAMVTNTAPNGTGGIVYKLAFVPEPTAFALLLAAAACQFVARRRNR